MKTKYAYLVLVLVVAFAGAWLARPKVAGTFGGTDVAVFTGSSTNGEISVATTDTNIIARNAARQYLRLCMTSTLTSSLRQVTFAVNSSASHGRGFVLDSRVPCIEFRDPIVTGAFEGVASPSAASVSYSEF